MKVKVITSDVEGALEVVSLTTGLDGMIYGGHTGSKNHLFCELNPATLKIRDLGSKVVSSNELFLNDGKVVNQKIHHALSTLPDGRIAGGTGQNITAFQESFRQKDDEGGHLFVYDPSDEAAVDFGVPVPHEWIINTTVSPDGERVFGMTYLTNTFFAFNIKSGELEFSDQVHGRIFGDSSCTHSIICDLEGNVYGSCRDGRIFIYNSRERELTETEL
ncbi:MAG: hypothetical protein KAG97_11640, partial [Victivallales bacterium]|nr:hypothetical protein [Victivallales bacterium]